MRCKSARKIVCRSDVNVSVRKLEKADVRDGLPTLLTELRETPFAPTTVGGLPPEAPEGGEGWRRGRDSNPRYGCPYAAFRVRCDRPLCHLSVGAEPGRSPWLRVVCTPSRR